MLNKRKNSLQFIRNKLLAGKFGLLQSYCNMKKNPII